MRFSRVFAFSLICLATCGSLMTPSQALAGPPSYLLLRQAESPGPRHHPGYPSAVTYDVRTQGYAYGWFGVAPRSHGSRHFGIFRNYTQWSSY